MGSFVKFPHISDLMTITTKLQRNVKLEHFFISKRESNLEHAPFDRLISFDFVRTASRLISECNPRMFITGLTQIMDLSKLPAACISSTIFCYFKFYNTRTPLGSFTRQKRRNGSGRNEHRFQQNFTVYTRHFVRERIKEWHGLQRIEKWIKTVYTFFRDRN